MVERNFRLRSTKLIFFLRAAAPPTCLLSRLFNQTNQPSVTWRSNPPCVDKSLSTLIAIKIWSKPGETPKKAEAIYSKLLMVIQRGCVCVKVISGELQTTGGLPLISACAVFWHGARLEVRGWTLLPSELIHLINHLIKRGSVPSLLSSSLDLISLDQMLFLKVSEKPRKERVSKQKHQVLQLQYSDQQISMNDSAHLDH